MTLDGILSIYNGSRGEDTTLLYVSLERLGPRGVIAMNLIRTCKASERAKVYKGRRFVAAAYDKKDWSIANLCRALVEHGDDLGIVWGWARDEKAINFEEVIYIELPTGQISFHTSYRRDGPDYPGQWDGIKKAAVDRICRWTEAVLNGTELTTEGEKDVARQDRPEGGAAADAPGPEERQETLDF